MSDDKEDIIEWPEFDKISFCDCVGLNQHAYNRARECVNALAGVENPKEYLETILKQREELAGQVKELTFTLQNTLDLLEFHRNRR